MSFTVGMTITGNAEGAKRAADMAGQSVEELKRSTQQYGPTAQRGAEVATRAYRSTQAALKPLVLSQNMLVKSEREAANAARQAAAAHLTSAQAMRTYNSATAGGGAAVESLSRRLSNGVSVQRRAGIAVQNMSFQFADFATQVGSGQSATIALGQQLPQLLGGFGVLGAVMGAVVAIGVPLARVLFDAEEEADDLDTTIDALAGSVTDFTTITDRSLQPLRDLGEEYGLVDEQLRGMLESQRELARVTAQADLDAVGTGLAGLGYSESWWDSGGQEAQDMAARRRGLAEFADEMSITRQEANRLLNTLFEISGSDFGKEGAEAAEAQRAAYAAAREELLAIAGSYDGLNTAQRELLDKLLKGEEAATRLLGTTQKLPEGVAAAASAAGLMALNFRNALDYASGISSLQATLLTRETDVELAAQYGDDRVGLAGAQAGVSFDRDNPIGRGQSAAALAERAALRERSIAVARREAENRRSGTGGGSGGATATNAEAAAIQKLIAGLEDEIELLGELDPVNQEMIRLRDKMVGATEAEIEAVRALIIERNAEREAMEASIERLDTIRSMGQEIWGTLISNIREGSTAAEIFYNILDGIGQRLTDMAGNALMDALFGSSGSSDGGAIGGVLGDLFSSVFQFADGGVVNGPALFGFNNGQTGLMGEAGPEAIMPLTHGGASQGVGAVLGGRETTLPLTRLSSGKLGVEIKPFALGGIFGAANRPVAPRNQTSEPATAAGRGATTGHGGVTNFYISTPDPRRFAENRATAVRGASRMLGQMGRFT
ncbi:MAG: hypothetical protein WD046_13910 [Paracoccaceae bacterium]